MIYDLKNIADKGNKALQSATTDEQKNVALTIGKIDALLAIAERIEALADVQKPRWVEFRWQGSGLQFVVDARDVHSVGIEKLIDLYECATEDVEVVTFKIGAEVGKRAVKGTLPEVMAKLRGDK